MAKRAKVGKVDPIKTKMAKREARIATGAGGFDLGRERSAGMLIDPANISAPYGTLKRMDAYRTSYAYGLSDRTGSYDVPTYFAQLNDKNGGRLYWPVTLKERYTWYRYFNRVDPYVGRALDLLTDLPMSKFTLNMPKMPDEFKDEADDMLDFFKYQLEVLDMFSVCHSILREISMLGNCFVFHEWSDEKKMWVKVAMLPPEEVYVFQPPFGDKKRIEYRPDYLIRLILESQGQGGGNQDELHKEMIANIPKEIVDMVVETGAITMDTDPMTGSFVHHIARGKSMYDDLGASVLERVLIPLIIRENYRYTQLSLANRNMTPKNLITAPGLMQAELDDLRTQIDLSYLDPEYSIVTNYEVTWQQIGPQDRLLDFSREYESIENQIFAALGVTRELLTGEGQFSGTKITVELLNTMFLLTRDILKNYIEKQLFVPICEARGWYTVGKYGNKKYYHPEVGFNRLTIRDNAEVFDSLYQLYAKGSLPIEVLYELFNLNAEEMKSKLLNSIFTVNDATFNRAAEEVNSGVGRMIVEQTNVLDKVVEQLGLKRVQPPQQDGQEGGSPGGFGDGQSGFGGFEEGSDGQEQDSDKKEDVSSDVEDFATTIVESLPEGATDEQIEKAVEEADKVSGGKT